MIDRPVGAGCATARPVGAGCATARPISTGADTSQADSQHDPCSAPTPSERPDTSAWSTSRSPASTARLPALGHASADLRARHFIAAQVPTIAAWDRVAGSAVTRVVGGRPLPPVMAMFAHGTQTLVPVICPITTISHPNPSRGGCQRPAAGTRVLVTGQRRPGHRSAWRGCVLPIMRWEPAQVNSSNCFSLSAGVWSQ